MLCHQNAIVKLSELSNGFNDHLMASRFPLSINKHVTVISAYAPIMTTGTRSKIFNDIVLKDNHLVNNVT